jgi:hypothetical protein
MASDHEGLDSEPTRTRDEFIDAVDNLAPGDTAELIFEGSDECDRVERLIYKRLDDGDLEFSIASSDGKFSDYIAAYAISEVSIEDKIPDEWVNKGDL